MGFFNIFVNLIWRLISNNYYSVLINGKSHGLFHSTRGVKQGDPLSPTMFIMSSEVLSRTLNSLFEDNQFVGFGVPKWCSRLSHLAYVHDTIIFSSSDVYSLEKIMSTLQDYERQSGQKVNKDKSFNCIHQNTGRAVDSQIALITAMNKGKFPMKYLGCPITHKKKKRKKTMLTYLIK